MRKVVLPEIIIKSASPINQEKLEKTYDLVFRIAMRNILIKRQKSDKDTHKKVMKKGYKSSSLTTKCVQSNVVLNSGSI
jgi:hypothetical protein